jgi:hypothetical protein
MATPPKNKQRSSRSHQAERTFVYRGIKIAPIAGKRSKTATTLREALKTKAGPSRGRPAHA